MAWDRRSCSAQGSGNIFLIFRAFLHLFHHTTANEWHVGHLLHFMKQNVFPIRNVPVTKDNLIAPACARPSLSWVDWVHCLPPMFKEKKIVRPASSWTSMVQTADLDRLHNIYNTWRSVFAGHVLRGQERFGSWRRPNGYVTDKW